MGKKKAKNLEDLAEEVEGVGLSNIKKTIEERIAFRKTNKIIKKIEGKLDDARQLYQKNKAGLDYRKVRNHWHYDKLAERIKKSDLSLEETKMLAKLKTGAAETTNIAKGEMEIFHKGELVFTKKDYWSSASKVDLLSNGKGIEKSVEKLQNKLMYDTGAAPKGFRTNDSEIKMTAAMDEDIAKIGTDLGVDIKNLEIKTKILTTYDPCNVCKRDILARAITYPNSSFEIVRPLFKDNITGKILPVGNNSDFTKFLIQNNLK